MTRSALRGNYIAEWFGYRVWPSVDSSDKATSDQTARLCPFLSVAIRDTVNCIKAARGYDEPTGVCTISSDSNVERQDWLACPFRVLDQNFTLLGGAIRTVFQVPDNETIVLLPTSVFDRSERRKEVIDGTKQANTRVFAYAADKLGGEVNVPETDGSPGCKVDVSVIEILATDAADVPSDFGQHMFLEIQTADFHGSPLHAVCALAEKCPQFAGDDYHERIRQTPEDCGRKVEGPNKANIFKRTIYQMILKMELAHDPTCAGFVIVLPMPVWDSWLRHLGNPAVVPSEDGPTFFRLGMPKAYTQEECEPSWIFVFDIDRESGESPQPLKIVYRISTTPQSLIHFAFHAAPTYATEHSALERFRQVLVSRRVLKLWQA